MTTYAQRRSARAVAEIVARYESQGLRNSELGARLDRHANTIEALDPSVAAGLRAMARKTGNGAGLRNGGRAA